MIKYKKCKGQNRAKDYEGCGKEVLARTRKYGLCMYCYRSWLIETDEGKELLSKAIIKAQKPRKELEQAEAEHKENKSLSWLLKNTVNICHKYIRERDKGKPCISCGETWHSDFQAGHFYKAELYSSLKFNENNIHGQCPGCNLYKEGNESQYRTGLIKRYSKGYLDLLDSKALLDKQKPFKWDRNALNEIREYYKQKLKEL